MALLVLSKPLSVEANVVGHVNRTGCVEPFVTVSGVDFKETSATQIRGRAKDNTMMEINESMYRRSLIALPPPNVRSRPLSAA